MGHHNHSRIILHKESLDIYLNNEIKLDGWIKQLPKILLDSIYASFIHNPLLLDKSSTVDRHNFIQLFKFMNSIQLKKAEKHIQKKL